MTAVLAWVIVVSTVRRLPVALFGFDQIVSTLALYLAVTGASGQAVSLDRFLRRWRAGPGGGRARAGTAPAAARRVVARRPGVPRPTVSANLALRLIQLHLALIYGMAGLAKLQGPVVVERHGALGDAGGRRVRRPVDFTWLAAWPLLLNFLTHASLALELLYPVLIWVPILRPLMIAGAVLLHLGIARVVPGLTEFGLAMIAATSRSSPARWLRSLVTGRQQPALRVLYDGACPRCRASMAWSRRPTPTASSSRST